MRRTLPLLLLVCPALVVAQDQDARELFERAYYQEHALKQLDQAIGTYRRVAALAGAKDRELAGRALVRVAACEQARGRDVEAREVLDEVLRKFADVPAVKQAAEALLGENGGPRRSLRIHDVEFLLASVPDCPAPSVRLIPEGSREEEEAGGARMGALSFDDGPDVPAGRAIDAEQLLELIQRNIAEDSWANDRNTIDIQRGRLIVVQTAEVHAEIARYLERLKALRGRVISFELTLAAVQGGLARELVRVGAGPLPEAKVRELEKRLLAGAPQGAVLLERHRLSAYDRQQVHVAALRELSYVEQEVNQTGVVPVLNPRVASGHEGLLIELRPALVGQGDHLLLETTASWSRWSFRELEVQAGDLAALGTGDVVQLPRAEQLRLQGCAFARGGATFVACAVQSPRFAQEGLEDPHLVLLIRPELSEIATGKSDGGSSREARTLRIHDVSLLTYVPERGDEDDTQALPGDTLIELVQRNVAEESWASNLNSISGMAGGALAIVNTPEVQAQVESFLATLRRARGRALSLEVQRLSLSPEELTRLLEVGQAAGAGEYVVPVAAVDQLLVANPARLAGWAAASTWEGQEVRLRDRSYQAYLRNHERSSGGTGEKIVSLSYPVTGVARDGLGLVARAKLLPDRKHVSIDLRLETAELEKLEQARTSTGPIELPRVRERTHRCSVSFPLDQVLVVGASLGRAPGAGRGVVLVRVRAQNLLGDD